MFKIFPRANRVKVLTVEHVFGSPQVVLLIRIMMGNGFRVVLDERNLGIRILGVDGRFIRVTVTFLRPNVKLDITVDGSDFKTVAPLVLALKIALEPDGRGFESDGDGKDIFHRLGRLFSQTRNINGEKNTPTLASPMLALDFHPRLHESYRERDDDRNPAEHPNQLIDDLVKRLIEKGGKIHSSDEGHNGDSIA